MAYFLGGYRYDKSTAALDAARPAHRDYLSGLAERGQVVLAGPLVGQDEGRVIYRAADLAEVQALVAADPYVTLEGATALTPVEWTVVIHDESNA